MDSHAYQNQDVHNPPVEFSRFLDGESFMQEDLVLWVKVGMHHLRKYIENVHWRLLRRKGDLVADVKYFPANSMDMPHTSTHRHALISSLSPQPSSRRIHTAAGSRWFVYLTMNMVRPLIWIPLANLWTLVAYALIPWRQLSGAILLSI